MSGNESIVFLQILAAVKGPSTTDIVWLVVLMLIGFTGLGLVVKLLMRWMTFPCQICTNTRVTFVRKMPAEEQEKILDYFRQNEHRESKLAQLFVCQACRRVYDEFSGEYRSRSSDGLQLRFSCKVCNKPMAQHCDQRGDPIICRHCQTVHIWREHQPSGYIFLAPPPDVDVLPECNDPFIYDG